MFGNKRKFQFYLSSIKRRAVPAVVAEQPCFNSTLVQLKGYTPHIHGRTFFCFNSTLVQLKAAVVTSMATAMLCFNSTLVQLKETPGVNVLQKFISFNSTLVQLKGLCWGLLTEC